MKLIKNLKSQLIGHHFFKNGWMVGFLSFLLLTNLILITLALLRVSQTDVPIPLRFTSIANFDQLGKWYQLYEIVIASLVVMIINSLLALLSFKKSRLASIFLMTVAILVNLEAIAILYGLTSINYGLN